MPQLLVCCRGLLSAVAFSQNELSIFWILQICALSTCISAASSKSDSSIGRNWEGKVADTSPTGKGYNSWTWKDRTWGCRDFRNVRKRPGAEGNRRTEKHVRGGESPLLVPMSIPRLI